MEDLSLGEIKLALSEIRKKLDNSSVLNGGFEVLLADIKHIKEDQKEIKEAISTVKKSVYDPDEGLFSRVKELESKHEMCYSRHAAWEKFSIQLEPVVDRHKEISISVSAIESELDNLKNREPELLIEMDRLTQWKSSVTKLLWIIVAAVSSLVIKTLFNILV